MAAISIITINYNNAEGLEQTIKSVVDQNFRDYEFIIIDGGSADGSVEIIEQYSHYITKWVSEPDNGIFNAMNKGIASANGNYLFFLNSGDILIDKDILSELSGYFDGTQIIYGDLLISSPTKKWIKKYNKSLTFQYFISDTLPHQGAFIQRALFDTVGVYDESLRLCADWKFFMDAVCKFNVTTKYVDKTISVYDFTGISSIESNRDRLVQERNSVLKKSYFRFICDYEKLAKLERFYQPLEFSKGFKLFRFLQNKYEKIRLKISK